MTVTTKQKVVLSVIALTVAYGAGRWASPTKVVTKTVTVEVEKKTDDVKSDLNLDKHRETTTVVLKKPDGTEETTTHVTEDTTANKTRDEHSTDQVNKTSSQTKEVTYTSPKVTVSALAGLSFSGSPAPAYGASISKPILGPVTVGLWGLSNATGGVSLGLTF